MSTQSSILTLNGKIDYSVLCHYEEDWAIIEQTKMKIENCKWPEKYRIAFVSLSLFLSLSIFHFLICFFHICILFYKLYVN